MGLWRDGLGGIRATAVDSGLGRGVHSIQSVGGEGEIEQWQAMEGPVGQPRRLDHIQETLRLNDKSVMMC